MSPTSRDPNLPFGGLEISVTEGLPSIAGEALFEDRYQGAASDGSVNMVTPLELGTPRRLRRNRKFMYVENASAAAFVEGTVLTTIGLTAVASIASAADRRSLTGFTNLKVNEWAGGYAFISAGTGDGECRHIIGNTATVVYLERPLSIDASAATVQLTHPYRVKATVLGDGITQKVSGVSYGAVPAQTGSGQFTAGGVSYFGWMQVHGLCEKVLVSAAINTGANGLVASSGADGKAIAIPAGDLTSAFPFAYLPAKHGGAAWDVSVPAFLYNCQG